VKGAIKEDHIPINKYELVVLGLPPITFTSVTGLEDEIQTTDLPDRTRATGGNRGPTELVARHPLHHTGDRAAMEIWFRESQDPVTPTYKKPGYLSMKSISGQTVVTYPLIGMFPTKRVIPDLEMENEGEMAQLEWTISADDVLPPV